MIVSLRKLSVDFMPLRLNSSSLTCSICALAPIILQLVAMECQKLYMVDSPILKQILSYFIHAECFLPRTVKSFFRFLLGSANSHMRCINLKIKKKLLEGYFCSKKLQLRFACFVCGNLWHKTNLNMHVCFLCLCVRVEITYSQFDHRQARASDS